MDGVARLDTIHGRLRVYGDETSLVESDQLIADNLTLGRERAFAPRQAVVAVLEVVDEDVGDVADGFRLPPLLPVLLTGSGQANPIGVKLTESRRPRVTPSTVGELVPFLST